MTIPIGRRRLVVALTPQRPPALAVPTAPDATDAELVRLAAPAPAALERARWEAMSLMYGPRLS